MSHIDRQIENCLNEELIDPTYGFDKTHVKHFQVEEWQKSL